MTLGNMVPLALFSRAHGGEQDMANHRRRRGGVSAPWVMGGHQQAMIYARRRACRSTAVALAREEDLGAVAPTVGTRAGVADVEIEEALVKWLCALG